MIDLTVKTLDSQNHAFSLADDITIREFKEHIAATVNVAADSQRLIYCGRVLQDEKHLSDYDVNGKVIHLVHRAPPQSVQHANGRSQGQGQNDQAQNREHAFRQTRAQFHGNPMYLGSISIPAEVVEGPESPLPQLSITLATSRTTTAQRMLQEANLVLDRLESATPSATRSSANESSAAASRGATATRGDGTATADSSPSDASVSENDESASSNDANADLPQSASDFLDLFLPDHSTSAVSNAAYQIAVGFVRAARSSDNSESGEGNNGTLGSEASAPAAEPTDENQSATQDREQSPRQERSNAASENNRPSEQNSGTTPMGVLLRTLMETEDRLRPHLLIYRQLMLMDPVIPSENIGSGENQFNLVERNQRLIEAVSECLHYLAHANHALSDVIVDLGQQPPRNLRCRPVLIHQSAILQGAIPIQVEAHISVARNDGTHGESANGEENNESANRPPTWTAGGGGPPTGQPATEAASDQPETTSSAPPQQSEQQHQRQAPNHPRVNSTIGAIFNLTNNMELLMEMTPSENGGGITVSGVGGTGTQPGQNNGSNNNNNTNVNNNAPGASGVPGMIPWGPVPPPGLIQNLMNAVAGYMVQGAGNVAAAAAAANAATPTTTTTATTTTTTPTNPCLGYLRRRGMASADRRASRNPGQSTQARSNVDTHPTTSTQTRSTSRLHVIRPNAHPLGVGMGHNMDFDILLPCNSHHIRRAQPNAAATPNNSTATSSPQQTSQPSQSTTPNGVVTQQPEGSTTAGNASNATPARTEKNVRLQDEIAKQRRSDGTKSENPVTLEELLLSRGISTCPERLPLGTLSWQLYTACAKIDLSEWYALIYTGKFNCEDTWNRLRTEITNLMSFTGKVCAGTFVLRISREIELYFRNIWGLDDSSRIVDDQWMLYGVNMTDLIRQLLREIATFVEENVNIPDEEWGSNLSEIVQRRAREICTIFRTSLYRKQAAVENLIRTFALRASSNHHPEFRDWIVDCVAQWFCEYSRPREGELDAEDARRIDETSEMPIFEDVAGILRTHMIPPSQPEPEPMETEEASGTRVMNDPLEVDDGEEVPASFPGHEQLLPEWVPIIARDGLRQRRQLQLQSEGITGFSDAYLEGLPSKRRKLVEHLKPRLLVNPAPNQSVISASVERLVRDSVFGASVEEADGSAAAVAADPGVRRAFGRAIRECLDSRRLESPIFPDSRRFPNATRYFSDKDKPAKQ